MSDCLLGAALVSTVSFGWAPQPGDVERQFAVYRRIFSPREEVWSAAVQALGTIARDSRNGRGPDLVPSLVETLLGMLTRGTSLQRERAAFALGEIRVLPERIVELIQARYRIEAMTGDAEVSVALMHTLREIGEAKEKGEYCRSDVAGMLR